MAHQSRMRKNTNGNGQKIHTKMLLSSTPDTVQLGDAVESRFLRLCADYSRIKHEDLTPPSDLDADMLLWRTMMVRHKQEDFRNSEDELKATKRVADWTHKVNCEIKGQKYTPIEWDN